MQMTARTRDGATILDLDGPLTAGADTRPLRAAVERAKAASADLVVLDLHNTSRLDCAGIGVLLDVYRVLRPHGTILTLINVNARHERMLELAGLLRVLRVRDATGVTVPCAARRNSDVSDARNCDREAV